MAGYRQSRPEKAKAAAAAVVIHLAIGAAFLTGLATDVAQRQTDALQTFDVAPPPPPVINVEPDDSAPSGDPGESGRKAEPTPVVAPEPEIAVPATPPIAAAPIAGQGAAPSAGAAAAGTGTGAGGRGQGLGGSGIGTEARLLSGNRSGIAGRLLRQLGDDRGYAHLLLTVAATGRVTECKAIQGSGSAEVDRHLCGIMIRQSRWAPARDLQGRPLTVQVRYTSTWSRD